MATVRLTLRCAYCGGEGEAAPEGRGSVFSPRRRAFLAQPRPRLGWPHPGREGQWPPGRGGPEQQDPAGGPLPAPTSWL